MNALACIDLPAPAAAVGGQTWLAGCCQSLTLSVPAAARTTYPCRVKLRSGSHAGQVQTWWTRECSTGLQVPLSWSDIRRIRMSTCTARPLFSCEPPRHMGAGLGCPYFLEAVFLVDRISRLQARAHRSNSKQEGIVCCPGA